MLLHAGILRAWRLWFYQDGKSNKRVVFCESPLERLKLTCAGGVGQKSGQGPRRHPVPGTVAEARYLFSQGFTAPAAVSARVVLECRIRSLFEQHGCESPCKIPHLNSCVRKLVVAGVFEDWMKSFVHSSIHIGNAAAHGRPVKRKTVAKMLYQADLFLQAFPLEEKGASR